MDADHRPDANDGRSPRDGRDAGTTTSDERAEGRRRRNRHHAYRRKSKPRYDGTPSGTDAGNAAPTSAEMRAARASGRTPGISAADEPAAAPLGTDDEAAGTPPSEAALQHEIDRSRSDGGMRQLSAEDAMKGRPGHPEESPRAFGKLVTIGAAVVILVVLALVLF